MIKSFNVPTVSIGQVLTLKGKHYDFFRKIFDRVCTLSTRQTKDGETNRQAFENILKLECVPHADSYIKNFINHVKHRSPEIQSVDFLIHFYALNTLDAAYKYCCQEEAEAKGGNSLYRLVFGPDTPNYLVEVIDYLSDLEGISATHLTDKIVKHFIDKAVEKAIQKERAPRKKGAQVKHENREILYRPIKQKALELFTDQAYKSKYKIRGRKPFARHFTMQHNAELMKNNPNLIDKELLKESTVEKWIKDFLAE